MHLPVGAGEQQVLQHPTSLDAVVVVPVALRLDLRWRAAATVGWSPAEVQGKPTERRAQESACAGVSPVGTASSVIAIRSVPSRSATKPDRAFSVSVLRNASFWSQPATFGGLNGVWPALLTAQTGYIERIGVRVARIMPAT